MAKVYSGFKHYTSQQYKNRKQYHPIEVGEKFSRLTVIEVQPRKNGEYSVVVCRCECSHIVKTSSQSLRKGFVTACDADMALEKKYAREIEVAKEVERLTSAHVDPAELPQRPKWEFAGAEDELIAKAEKQK
jgi:hypothetical protein